MSRELIILRHAKSSWGDTGISDHERILNDRGRRDAPRMGAWLAREALLPDHLRVSTANRAAQTLALVIEGIVAEQSEWQCPEPSPDARIYDAGLDDLLAVVGDCPADARRVLLVGHNPGLEDLLDHLCDGALGDEDGLLATCTAAVVAMPDDWRGAVRGCGRLLRMQRPRDLA